MGRLGALPRPTCTSYAGCAQWDYGYFAMCHMSLQVNIEQICPSGEDVADRRQKGCISITRQGGWLVFPGRSPVVWFSFRYCHKLRLIPLPSTHKGGGVSHQRGCCRLAAFIWRPTGRHHNSPLLHLGIQPIVIGKRFADSTPSVISSKTFSAKILISYIIELRKS